MAGSLLSLVAILDLLPSEQFASLLAVEDLVALELVENLLDSVQAENPGGSPGAGVQRQCCAFLHSHCLGGSVHVWKQPHEYSEWEERIVVSLVVLLL